MNGYTTALRRYAEFNGRSRRSEYWGFALTNLAISIVFSILLAIAGFNYETAELTGFALVLVLVFALYSLAILIPSLALQWRRYQDIGWPGPVSIIGWFVSLLTLVVAFIPGNPGANQYGPDPKA
ncbi:DUF805 domain-containing protein [Demequina mangrovi]|uniref:Uncharacterized membrane protein YhaH, DUF805 family n=1 Tax=Demequina mangrovi TaxID=1043493 RepID=A0A1H7A7T3_9MICO|nr:DUF805 domain-containing protein [Demequina mangrovi]SEJ58122.1 Uncharacterized membrane protein YhaH, DUF805 family [Demequina mangrovi]